MIKRIFLSHPHSVGETYPRHMQVALGFAAELAAAAIACLVHAVVPMLFERTASRAIQRLHERMVLHRRPAATSPSPSPSSGRAVA